MLLSPYPTAAERIRVGALWTFCVLVLVFLVVPIIVPVPLSFNSGSFFTFPLAGLSTRWYEVVLGTPRWRAAIGNSLLIGFGATVLRRCWVPSPRSVSRIPNSRRGGSSCPC